MKNHSVIYLAVHKMLAEGKEYKAIAEYILPLSDFVSLKEALQYVHKVLAGEI